MREREIENALRNMGDLKKEMSRNLNKHFRNVMDSVDEGFSERGMGLEFDILPEDVETLIRDTLFVSYVHGTIKSVYDHILDFETMNELWSDCVENGVDDIDDISPRTKLKVKGALGI